MLAIWGRTDGGRFLSLSALTGALHAARASGTYDRAFRQLAKVSLIIIIDFGLKPLRSPHGEDIHDLISIRYE
ncbi:ATP-binding protein [Acidithiobacillus sulfuriphilus]|uniref:ATP-binding protein n=1 Tax=Acidithiobacillus sulfuriphilus TaxID=1867749 RepID=UPI003F61C376